MNYCKCLFDKAYCTQVFIEWPIKKYNSNKTGELTAHIEVSILVTHNLFILSFLIQYSCCLH